MNFILSHIRLLQQLFYIEQKTSLSGKAQSQKRSTPFINTVLLTLELWFQIL